MKIYAVIDGSHAKGLLTQLSDYPLRHSCLYNEPIQDDLRAFSPYLVELSEAEDDPFKAWLIALGKEGHPWGLYLFATVDFQKLRQHLRKYTYAQIPIEEKPVMFRYYDPRVFWWITEILEDWQLANLLGPIELVSSYFEGDYREDHFSERRTPEKMGKRHSDPLLTLDSYQFDKLNAFYQNRYEVALKDYIIAHLPEDYFEEEDRDGLVMHQEMLRHQQKIGRAITHPLDIELLNMDIEEKLAGDRSAQEARIFTLAKDINRYCLAQDIEEDRFIKGIARLFLRDEIYDFSDMKLKWKEALDKNADSGSYRAKMLLLNEFGTLRNI